MQLSQGFFGGVRHSNFLDPPGMDLYQPLALGALYFDDVTVQHADEPVAHAAFFLQNRFRAGRCVLRQGAPPSNIPDLSLTETTANSVQYGACPANIFSHPYQMPDGLPTGIPPLPHSTESKTPGALLLRQITNAPQLGHQPRNEPKTDR